MADLYPHDNFGEYTQYPPGFEGMYCKSISAEDVLKATESSNAQKDNTGIEPEENEKEV